MSQPTLKVLLIEDNPADARLIREALADARRTTFQLESAATLAAGQQRLVSGPVDIVLLDLSLPDSQGLETFRRLHHRWPQVPIVVLSGDEDDTVALTAVNEGAQDFLVKQRVDGDAIGRAIRYAIERHRMLEQVRQLAILDPLTTLANRRGFTMLCEHHFEVAKRASKSLTLLYIDVDRMKSINDTFGHAEGDRALIDTARLMAMTFRKADILARLGGDEFCVMLTDSSDQGAQLAVARLRANLAAFNAGNRRGYALGLSVGTARFDPEAPRSLASLLEEADQAMYREKRRDQPDRRLTA